MKEKVSSLKAIGLEALLRRLPEHHSRYADIENELRKTRAGENGERILANVFQQYQFPFKHYVFHDVNLQSTGKFQIDTLFLFKQGAVILEVKNIAGHIRFSEEHNQMTRTLENGQVDAFECPSVQLERNKILLEDWFHAHHISMPIYQAAVFPRPQQQFENLRKDLTLLFPLEIPVYLRRLSSFHPTIDVSQLTDIANKITDAHREYDPFPLTTTYGILPSELLPGVRCKQCGSFGMQSIYNGWGCRHCGKVDPHAHVQALLDYFMLIDYRISNKEFRRFLQLDSVQKAKRILGQLGIPFEGEKKGRFYVADLKVIRELHDLSASKVPK
ncbi:NERD domain-containing protein [Sporosarcina sp. ACRSL]|uniref:nuclease-related domain-containing protein n=1 Tax=Sporosarcina sp. ACRSL TaxID=2918215 RepID=UPI001EF45C26|nr:nuclease-related domain-containing protein [Sporosarcina sp. ACRSL]MCG7345887.1 NERD domain-containing protein [Sporosarcina sp. ACRSL]